MEMKRELLHSEAQIRDGLIQDVQDLIWALKFEKGPQPKGRIQNDSLLFFAIIEQACLQPLPWQTIKVDHIEYQNPAMYEVLKAAKRALEVTDLNLLSNAKNTHAGEYDKVKTWFGGKQPSTSGYGHFAKSIGTVSNQPGALVGNIVEKVENFLQALVANKLQNKEVKQANYTPF